jgi:hypothetical protein
MFAGAGDLNDLLGYDVCYWIVAIVEPEELQRSFISYGHARDILGRKDRFLQQSTNCHATSPLSLQTLILHCNNGYEHPRPWKPTDPQRKLMSGTDHTLEMTLNWPPLLRELNV